jgi:hypothetical protein
VNHLKKILKILVALLALSVSVITGILIYESIDKIDTFSLRNAELINPTFLYELDSIFKTHKHENSYKERIERQSVYIHRIKEGTGLILAYRFYSNGKVSVMDDEFFEKLTIWISDSELKSTSQLILSDRSKVLAVYTQGGSAWPEMVCSGYINSEDIKVDFGGGGYKVALMGKLSPTGNRGNSCNPKIINKTFFAKNIEFKNLTTWLGKPGNHPYQETYR